MSGIALKRDRRRTAYWGQLEPKETGQDDLDQMSTHRNEFKEKPSSYSRDVCIEPIELNSR
ncbi:MAG: hypothetical protein NWE76_01820, partial [Candidatus Bathyarchaeota archaeon]|nr:hypothetical protein [Candidatus Bathyarchaeota archaeon]